MRVERAAGGLVTRRGANGVEVLLIDDAYGKVSFPKGHLEAGETWEDAALREVREETGISAKILCPLGRVEYQISRGGRPVRKQVRLFLMEVLDDAERPVAQQEELRAAYFQNFADARARHEEAGYANWSFVFDKADVLLEWHANGLESAWRGMAASAPVDDVRKTWEKAQPLVVRLGEAVLEELSLVWPELSLPNQGETVTLPRTLADEQQALLDAVEHTLLKADASQVDVENLCHDAVKWKFRAVCVNPQHVGLAAEICKDEVVTCTVCGFPLGASAPEALAAEARTAASDGATEVDMVLPVASMREDDIWTVHKHIQSVCEAAHGAGAKVKVIFETHYLSIDQLVKACLLALSSGVDFVKTSTGFAPTGAKLADVALMRLIVGDKAGVKAAGGIRTREDALQFLRYGADRLGTSSGVSIVRQ